MKSKGLLGIVQLAAMVAIGATQMHQAMPIMAKLAHRAAAPLEQMVLLGIPSYSRSPVPAVQPFALPALEVCDRAPMPPAHIRHTVVRVEAPRPVIQTIDSSVTARVMPRRMYLARIDTRALGQLVEVQMNRADVQREIARAQRELERTMREAHRQQTVVF